MLNNIKSYHFLKLLFSHVFERRKLKIIKYDKSLQNKIDINLTNYKMYKGSYIIHQGNGKFKEYNGYGNINILIFEGEFLNGERNGKGKEYELKDNASELVNERNGGGNDHDYFYVNLKFEGEYLNGKRNGEGKEYYKDGNIIFEGEYLNGERRKGKEYGEDGKLIFEGEYLYDEKNGKGEN